MSVITDVSSDANQNIGDGDSFSPEECRRPRAQVIYSEGYNPDKDIVVEDIIHSKTEEEKENLKNTVNACFLFKEMDDEQKMRVIDVMIRKEFKENEFILQQGEDGDTFYIVNEGKFDAFVNSNHISSYTSNDFFGELALLYNMSRPMTVKATTKGSLFVLDRKTFKRIVLGDSFRKRKMYENLIAKVPMLQELNSYEKANVADALIPRKYKKDDVIVRQGEAANGMYFLEMGVVDVCFERVKCEEPHRVISKIERGGYFGELALVTKKPRALTVIAASDEVKCAFLDVEAFERLLGPCMEIMKRNIQTYTEQLNDIFGKKCNF